MKVSILQGVFGAILGFIVGTLLFALMLIIISDESPHFLNPQDISGKIIISLIVSTFIGGLTGFVTGFIVGTTRANTLAGFGYGSIVGAIAFLYFYFNLNPIPLDANFLEVIKIILFFPILPTSITGLIVSSILNKFS